MKVYFIIKPIIIDVRPDSTTFCFMGGDVRFVFFQSLQKLFPKRKTF